MGTPGDRSSDEVTRLLEQAPEEARSHLEKLVAQPAIGPDELRAELDDYWERLEAHGDEYEFLDLGSAWSVVSQCRRLLLWLEGNHTPERNRLVQAAVRYLVKSNDAESDLASPIGFDDDAEVVEVVAGLLGQEDLLSADDDS